MRSKHCFSNTYKDDETTLHWKSETTLEIFSVANMCCCPVMTFPTRGNFCVNKIKAVCLRSRSRSQSFF